MKARTWAVWLLAGATAHLSPASLFAQENPNPEQLKKMYDEAVGQLKAAQERKNQLAAENEKLGQQVTALKNELAATSAKLEELRRSDAEHAEKSFFMRAHYVAWQQFIRQSPELEARWRAYLANDFLAAPRDPWELIDRRWPLGYAAVSAAATQPASQPAPATAPTPATTPAPTPSTVPWNTQPLTQPLTQPSATQSTNKSSTQTQPTTGPSLPATHPATLPATLPSTQPTIRAV